MSTARQCLRVQLNTRAPAAAPSSPEVENKNPALPTSHPAPESTQCGPQPPYFRVIGRGTCGTVYEHSGLPAEIAIKVGSDRIALKRDFNHALRAFNASRAPRAPLASPFCSAGTAPDVPEDEAATFAIPRPLVPRPRKMLDDHDLGRLGRRGLRLEAVDDELFDAGPEDCEDFAGAEIPAAWEAERIGAVAPDARAALVDLFVAPALRAAMHADDESRDCLVRVYLGAESPGSGSMRGARRQRKGGRWHLDDGLRNAPLYLDQMRDVGLDARALAEEVAVGMATCHWGACLDGMDVEFVLGAPRLPRYRDRADLHAAPHGQPAARVWMLDFDKTALLPFQARGSCCPTAEDLVERFAVALHGNDPYFPRPSLDRALWDRFAEVYGSAGRATLRRLKISPTSRLQTLLALPAAVMARLAELYDEEEQWQRDADELVGFEDITIEMDDDEEGEAGLRGWGSDDDVSSASEEDEGGSPG
ncbi:hypothetical protein BJ166DRAFT_590798 [Pestalotiopsis sp. NC0098]|nr:hypothetical protein BJ166DRAFT_590798 [Pestalotiopsis sp. NC0098]